MALSVLVEAMKHLLPRGNTVLCVKAFCVKARGVFIGYCVGFLRGVGTEHVQNKLDGVINA